MHIKSKTNTEPRKQWEVHTTMNKQQLNHRLRTDSSLSYREGGGGLNAFYRRQILALDGPTRTTGTSHKPLEKKK